MTVLNDIDRFHLLMDVVDRVPSLENIRAHIREIAEGKLREHKHTSKSTASICPKSSSGSGRVDKLFLTQRKQRGKGAKRRKKIISFFNSLRLCFFAFLCVKIFY